MKALLPALFLAVASLSALAAKGGPPINDICPVDGKAGRVIYRVFTEKGSVIFCCVDCMDAYKKDPAKYTVTPKSPGK